jgi:AAA ATPase domain
MARSEAFVGRDRQLDELVGYWHAAEAGHGRFVVVSGEAGIGKTRLLECLGTEIDAPGRVAWGACAGSNAPALWPWRAVLRDLARNAEPDAMQRRTAESSELVDPEGEQARQYAQFVDAVRDAVSDGPVQIVLDDVHWADSDSVRLLRMVAVEARRLPLLLVATLRPDEVMTDAAALRGVLTDLASSTAAVQLDGLTVDAVGRLVRELTGRRPTAGLTSAVMDRTGGNPFFVRELMRLLVAEGSLDAAMAGAGIRMPPLVRDVLLQRVAQFSRPTRSVLDAAAVAGREVSLITLGRFAGVAPEDLARAVDEAEAARLVQVVDGRLRFEHDLVREALVEDLDAVDRRRLHLAAAHALRATGGPGASAGEIAGHLIDALPVGDPTEAAEAALVAGRESLARHAPADAVRQLEQGLAVLGGSESALRGSMLLALGEARSTAGDRPGARDAYRAAAEIARAAGDADRLAMSALGFAGVMGTPRTDPMQVQLLDESLAALGDRRDALMARVMARLAHALLFSDQRSRRLHLADDAVALAREVDDTGALASALYVWNIVHITSVNFGQRLERANELLALGRASGEEETEAWALHCHAHEMAEGGDFAAFDADVAACEVLAQRAQSATWQWTALVHRAMRAAMQGRFGDAERLGNEAVELGARSQYEVAAATFGAHLIALRTWQGRLDELLPMITAAAGRYAELPAVWASVPFAHAELGQHAEAAEELRHVLADRLLKDVPGAQSWTVALAMLARAAALTGDGVLAERVRELLQPLGDRHIIGPFADCYFGPVSLYAGLCSSVTGAVPDACGQLERALRQAMAVGARPVAAWTKGELAGALDRRGGDGQRVAVLRAEAAAELAELGMPRHLARLERSESPAPSNVFRRMGDGWSLTYAGRTVFLRSTKGLTDLHRLLSAPGTELHVLELAQEAEGEGLGVSGRQPLLDERAKAEYRRRLLALEREIEDARDCADLGRQERASSSTTSSSPSSPPRWASVAAIEGWPTRRSGPVKPYGLASGTRWTVSNVSIPSCGGTWSERW